MNAGTRFIAVHTKSLTVLTLGAVALADWLFYRHPVGWTLGLFAWALLLLTVLRGPRALRSGPAWVLLILLHGLVLALIDQPGTLNVLLTVAGLGAVALCARWGWKPDARVWLGRGILFFGIGWTQVLRDLATARRWRNRGTPAKRGSVLGRWLLPVTLSLVFVLLFAAVFGIATVWPLWLAALIADQAGADEHRHQAAGARGVLDFDDLAGRSLAAQAVEAGRDLGSACPDLSRRARIL